MKIYLRIVLMLLVIAAAKPAAADESFDTWLSYFRIEAQQKGISQETLSAALTGLTPNQKVIELDGKQPEKKWTFAEYRARVINQARIDKGRRMMAEHADLLNQMSEKYGVQPQYIVALWGIETSYGENFGNFEIIRSLATLAWHGRRASFFRKELMDALKILDEGHISLAAMKGSWAGAMGHNQFMPSSFRSFAQDGNGDGRKDIWSSLPDVFASTANYLSRSGWKDGERWGRAVKLPKGFTESMSGLEKGRTLAEWRAAGVTLPDGQALPVVEGMKAYVIIPDGVAGPAYLVYDNYRTIMKWNRSTYFATSVGLIADAIASTTSF